MDWIKHARGYGMPAYGRTQILRHGCHRGNSTAASPVSAPRCVFTALTPLQFQRASARRPSVRALTSEQRHALRVGEDAAQNAQLALLQRDALKQTTQPPHNGLR